MKNRRGSRGKIALSIIIPLYNEEKRFPSSFEKIDKYFSKKPFAKEYILVDDGSADKTFEMASSLKSKSKIIILRNRRNLGKGAAIKKAVLKAKGENIFFTDADLSTPIDEFGKLFRSLKNYEIAIGSRRLSSSSVHIKQPFHRRLLGGIFYFLFSAFFTRSIKDTNCGFKCYRSYVAKRLFAKLTNNRWGFDAEILYIANKFGFSINEIPVRWLNDPNSRVSSIRASVGTILELTRIKINDWNGRYGRKLNLSQRILLFLFNIFFHFNGLPDKDPLVKKAVSLYNDGDFEQLFTRIRLWDSPYKLIEKHIPKRGIIVDLGCGDGFLSNYLALAREKAKFIGIEMNKNRIRLADKGLGNTKFLYGNILKSNFPKTNVILLIHVLHHLSSYKDQELMLKKCKAKLAKNGRLIIIEIAEKPILKYVLTWMVDAFIVPILFEGKFFSTDFHYRKTKDWKNLFKKLGFSAKIMAAHKSKPFSHLLILAHKTGK